MKRRFENGNDFIEFEVIEKREQIDGIPETVNYKFKTVYNIGFLEITGECTVTNLNLIKAIEKDAENFGMKEVF